MSRHAESDSNSPLVAYDYPFATEVVRATVGVLAEQAVLVPEPSTWIMLLFGMMALCFRRGVVVLQPSG